MTEFAYLGIRELGRRLRAGETTAVALARYFIDRLDTVGRRYNAVVTLTEARAMRAAARADADLAAGVDRGPLHGIPYGAKDLLATLDYPTTWGAAPFRDRVIPAEATALTRLDAAGAVLVAKLAMVELAGGMGYEQPNASLTGPGLTPWNPAHWSGGSSSGSGSAVSAGCVPFAIGSETWGSIVSPASYCGVTGLRPTYGRVSRAGAMALCWSLDKLGPLALSADDCGLVLDALAGPDPADPTAVRDRYAYRRESARTGGFRLGLLSDGTDGAQPAVAANFAASVEVLRGLGTVEEVSLPGLPYAESARVVIAAEAASAFGEFITSNGVAGLTAPECRVRPFSYLAVTARDYLNAMRVRGPMARALDDLFARYDAIVAPTMGNTAPPIDRPFRRDGAPAGPQHGAAGNVAGLPAVAVPNGVDEAGLPTSLTFVGRAFAENAILAVADAYQRATDHHARRPPSE